MAGLPYRIHALAASGCFVRAAMEGPPSGRMRLPTLLWPATSSAGECLQRATRQPVLRRVPAARSPDEEPAPTLADCRAGPAAQPVAARSRGLPPPSLR